MSSIVSEAYEWPEIHKRVESLFKPPYAILDDPWFDSFPSLSSFFSKGKAISNSKTVNNFNLFLHIGNYKPDEINVKTVDGSVTVEAKHEVKGDATPKEFKRSYELPEGIDPSTLVFSFNENGLLIIKANKKVPVSEI